MVDTSIAMGYKPVQIDNPMNQLAQMLQIQQAQKQGQAADLSMRQNQQSFDETNKLNALYAGAIGPDGKVDRNKLFQGAAQQNLGSKIPGLQKGFLDTDEAQGKVDKQRVDLIDAKLKQSRQFLDIVQTPEQYIAWHEGNHSDPVLGPVLAARGVTVDTARAQIMQALQQPGGFQQLLQKSAMGIEKFSEMNKPTVHMQNLGGTSQVISTPGMGGAPTVLSNTPITQSADNAATIANAARTANMTDSRARDFNETTVEANNIKRAEVQGIKDITKGGQLASFDTMLGTLDRLGKHPGLKNSVGVRGAFPTMPGSDSANFQVELNNFQSQAFLPMVAQLKGMGALSDAEGKKLTQAVGALDLRMGEKAIRESIARITTEMNAARDRVAGVSSGPKPGDVQDGHRFKGGNPGDPKSWEAL